jgi:hypothetical protein
MAKIVKVNEDFSLRYNSREDQTGDTVLDLNIDFSNPKEQSIVATRLNTWLTAIGYMDLEVVVKEKK